jgi:hypothetical protein
MSDLGIGEFLVEGRVRAILVGGHHQSMAGVLQELAQAQLAGDAAKQFARLEVDLARGRRGHAAGIVVDLGNVVAGVGLRVAVDGIVIENGENFGHGGAPSKGWHGRGQAPDPGPCCHMSLSNGSGLA